MSLAKFQVRLPCKPISTNNLYMGRKVRSFDYRKFRTLVFKMLDNEFKSSTFELTGNLTLDMEVGFSSPLSDLSNSIKGLEDCLTEYLGFNDRQIVTIVLNKYLVNKGDEYVIVKLRKTKKDINRRVKYVKGV